RENLAKLRALPGVSEKLAQVFTRSDVRPTEDPDLMLYSGGFFSPHDRKSMDFIRTQAPDMLGELDIRFQDPRLEEMLFRYRARNFPASLSGEEMERWEHFRFQRL